MKSDHYRQCITFALLLLPLALPAQVDSTQLLRDAAVLSHDSLQGRRPGTTGGQRAQTYLRRRLATLGTVETQAFTVSLRGKAAEASNLFVRIPGTDPAAGWLVLSAHYDHIGIGKANAQGDSLYNGADDNASGTAAVLAIGKALKNRPLRHGVILALFDAEELGLRGARHFVAHPPVPVGDIRANLNLDMVGRNDTNTLYAVGTRDHAFLKPVVEGVAAKLKPTIRLRTGHDTGAGAENWTQASDHGAFRAAKIPYLYLGVEDHPDYHQASDHFDRLQPRFFHAATLAAQALVCALDEVAWPVRE